MDERFTVGHSNKLFRDQFDFMHKMYKKLLPHGVYAYVAAEWVGGGGCDGGGMHMVFEVSIMIL